MTKEQMTDSLSKVVDIANSGELSFNSAVLFFRIVTRTDFDFTEDGLGGWAWEKDLRLTAEERGNLTDLKKKGLLSMQLEEDTHRARTGTLCYWVQLTEKGKDLAVKMGAY